MKFLLDTHLDLRNKPAFSAASAWEVAIKSALGREDLQADARLPRRSLLDNGYLELSVTGAHAVAVSNIPPIHRDPFESSSRRSDRSRRRHPSPARLI